MPQRGSMVYILFWLVVDICSLRKKNILPIFLFSAITTSSSSQNANSIWTGKRDFWLMLINWNVLAKCMCARPDSFISKANYNEHFAWLKLPAIPSVCALKHTEALSLFLVIQEPVHFLNLFYIWFHHPHRSVTRFLAVPFFLYNLLLLSSFCRTLEKAEPVDVS